MNTHFTHATHTHNTMVNGIYLSIVDAPAAAAAQKKNEANARTAKGRQLHMMYVRIDIKADL